MAATFAAVFVAMFAAHHLGDHVLQTDFQAANKALPGWRGWAAMAGHLLSYHAAMVAALLALHLVDAPLTVTGCTAGIAFSAITHGLLDRRWLVRWVLEHTGSRAFAASTTPLHGGYLADQSLHVAALFVAALLVVSVG
jgi:hypothetical protein